MRRLLSVTAVAAMAAAGIGLGAGTASAATTWVVKAGQSIQAAVDKAKPGDTILIKPGHFRESVLVMKSGLKIRGSGAGPYGTVIEPASGAPKNECGKQKSGICIVSFSAPRVANVVIRDLYVQNYAADGVIALHSQNLLVQNVISVNNGGYGIARFDSTGGEIVKTVTRNNGEAGLYIGDSKNANVQVLGNDASGNLFGIFYRHSRNAFFGYNTMNGNCVGFMALSAPANDYATGGATFAYNTVRANNKACPGLPSEGFPATQGTGILMVGVTGMTIAQNAILNNRGSKPFSGGIVLESAKPFGGGPSMHNTIRNNTIYGNRPADIVDRSGGQNTIKWNHCNKSMPAGYCHG